MGAYQIAVTRSMQEWLATRDVYGALVTSNQYMDQTNLSYGFIFDEVTGGSYPKGGLPFTGVQAATANYNVQFGELDGEPLYITGGRTIIQANDLTFTNVDAADVGGIVFYVRDPGFNVNAPSNTDSTLLGYHRFDAPIDASGGQDITYQVPELGLTVMDMDYADNLAEVQG